MFIKAKNSTLFKFVFPKSSFFKELKDMGDNNVIIGGKQQLSIIGVKN